jgi:hypothetical protein
MGSIRGAQNIVNARVQVKMLWTAMMTNKLLPLLIRMPFRTGWMYSAIQGRLQTSQPGRVEIGAPGIPYAGYVDSMDPHINWTKTHHPNPVYHWMQWLMKNAEKFAMPMLREAVRVVGLDRLMGMSANAVAEMIYE